MRRLVCVATLALCLLSCQEKRMDRFEREAREFTMKHCPQQMDNVTTLDSMVFLKEGKGNLLFYYTLDVTDEQSVLLQNISSTIENEDLSIVKNSVEMVKYKDLGATISFIYLIASSGDTLARYDFTPEDYQ